MKQGEGFEHFRASSHGGWGDTGEAMQPGVATLSKAGGGVTFLVTSSASGLLRDSPYGR